jgi:hypothetical protein
MAIGKCLGTILPSGGCLEAVDVLSKENVRGEEVEFCKLSISVKHAKYMSYLPQFLYGLSRVKMEMFMNDDDPFLFLGASFFCVLLSHSLIDVRNLPSDRR